MSPAPLEREQSRAPALLHPGRWLWLFLLVPVVIGFTRLHFDVQVFDLLPSNLSAVEGLKLYQKYFANARELLITIQAADAEQADATAKNLAERLRQAGDLVESVTWQPPWLEHPEQAAELIAYLWFNQPPSEFAALTNRLAPARLVPALAATREELATSMSPQEIGRLSYDPFGLTRLPEKTSGAAPSFGQGQELFASPDGSFRIIFVKARSELRTYRDCAQWISAIKTIAVNEIAKTSHPHPVTLGYTGRPAFESEIALGMQSDMTKSIGGTAIIIAVLFWLAHRRIKPMLWLLTLLALILASTLGLGGLIFGTINVVSMGFAAILLGLAVDYAVVHYQEALAQPELSIPQIRHAIAPSIFWAAVTTISAFLVLNFGGLPGLGQLGTLVGLGVALAALIMIFEFLPPLFPQRNQLNPATTATTPLPHVTGPTSQHVAVRSRAGMIFTITAFLLTITAAILCTGLPKIDPTAAALRPRNSPAYEAVEKVQALLSKKREPLWLILRGPTASEVGHRLDQAQAVLVDAQSQGLISSFSLPTELWPRPQNQQENRAAAAHLAALGPTLREVALTNGFAERSMALTEGILKTWQSAAAAEALFWPTNPMSQWIFEKIATHTSTNFLTLGMITPAETASTGTAVQLARIQSELPAQDVWLSGWELLGSSIFGRVKANMWKVLLPMVILILLSLFLAFRRATEIGLSVAVLVLSALCLLSVMRLAGWSWNLLNLMALPLVLGTGVDYSIFMQLALRRHHGDLQAAYLSVGRALLLCGGTAIAGFGSLGFSSNTGMASLGRVCAVGVGSNMLIAIFLLPTWWSKLNRTITPDQRGPSNPGDASSPAAPSSLYRPHFWILGIGLARILPSALAQPLGNFFAATYWLFARHRRLVVAQNLAPALPGDPRQIKVATRSLFRNFARKVIDLWRFEAGMPIDHLLGDATGWEHFQAAQAQGRGVLLLTPHLGNWEFGGPMMTRRGVSLQVLTLAEPGRGFTRLRKASRAKWQVETLVVGQDPLAFVEVIKRLEAGATVALLIDRPPPPSAITVELFGQPFAASIAAAELARASGCALLPVYIPWEEKGYAAHMLPAIPYERPALRDRAVRQALTQQIIRTFEPIIKMHISQWYHFIPIWPRR